MSTGNARSSQFTGTLNAFATDTGGAIFIGANRGLVNLKRAKVIRGASLRDQCYRDYLYGKSAGLEKQIALMEGQFNALISNIVQTDAIAPTLRTTSELVTFVSLQRLAHYSRRRRSMQ
jgi:hypothetical protein